jgi:hypothetical protein
VEEEGFVIVLSTLMEVSVDYEFCCGFAEVALSGMVQETIPFSKFRPLTNRSLLVLELVNFFLSSIRSLLPSAYECTTIL